MTLRRREAASQQIHSLSGIRFFLAMAVFVCHLEIVVRASGDYRLPFIHGGFPVAAFFVLSGYLVGRKHTEDFRVFQPGVYKKFLLSKIGSGYVLYVMCLLSRLGEAFTAALQAGELRALAERLLYNLTLTQTLFPNGTEQSINSVS